MTKNSIVIWYLFLSLVPINIYFLLVFKSLKKDLYAGFFKEEDYLRIVNPKNITKVILENIYLAGVNPLRFLSELYKDGQVIKNYNKLFKNRGLSVSNPYLITEIIYYFALLKPIISNNILAFFISIACGFVLGEIIIFIADSKLKFIVNIAVIVGFIYYYLYI